MRKAIRKLYNILALYLPNIKATMDVPATSMQRKAAVEKTIKYILDVK